MATRRSQGTISDIDYYEDSKYRVKVSISLNKKDGVFSAEYNGENFHNVDLSEIKKAIGKYIYLTFALDWQPVIKIVMSGSSYSITDVIASSIHSGETYQRKHKRVAGKIDLETTRLWMAKRQDGEWMVCEEWDSKDFAAEGEPSHQVEFLGTSDRRANARDFYDGRNQKDFTIPYSCIDRCFDRNQTIHYLPYTDELWDGLNLIADKIGELHDRLQKLVGTDEGRARLMAVAERLLGSGDER